VRPSRLRSLPPVASGLWMTASRDAEPVVLTPSAGARPLDRDELELLRRIGIRWPADDGGSSKRALPIDPGLVPPHPPEVGPTRFGRFATLGQHEVEATLAASVGTGLAARMAQRARRLLFGAPLATSAVVQERMRKLARAARLRLRSDRRSS
jgi:hypothetical protein